MEKFLHSNETVWRLARTIVQGIIGVLMANIDLIFGTVSMPSEIKTVIVAITMAVLSPLMAELGKSGTNG